MRVETQGMAALLARHELPLDMVPQFAEEQDGGFEVNHERLREVLLQHSKHRKELARSAVATIREPTTAELAANFAGAMLRWSAGGFRTVSREQYGSRMAICSACAHWDGAARLGLGACRAPGCGCTRFKQWLATERCPLNKWPAV